uniref:Metallothionein-like protein n=1 Tax=Tamarix androssowii TaxID=189785 RepID=A0A1L1WCG6_9CARY|nr:metallothionein [Tamarix androssowii]
MSCCGGNCGCGADCKCGNGCGGCKMNPSLGYTETSSDNVALITGVAPKTTFADGAEMGLGAENGGCKCGADCKCDPCTCK